MSMQQMLGDKMANYQELKEEYDEHIRLANVHRKQSNRHKHLSAKNWKKANILREQMKEIIENDYPNSNHRTSP